MVGKIEKVIGGIPSLPVSITKVLEICNHVNVSPSDLNRVISLDPVLVGKVLKLINSAYYNTGQKVTTLVRAIIMLGINTVKNLALTTAVLGTLPNNKRAGGLNMEGLWRHSLCVGVAARMIAKKRGVEQQRIEERFTAGLLHDIGKIPLNMVLASEYFKTISFADHEQMSLFTAEAAQLGIDHCAAGEMIVKAWKLDGAVADAIIFHHNLAGYSGDNTETLYDVAIANYFASKKEIGFAGDRYPVKPDKQVWLSMGINEETLEELAGTVNVEIEKAKIFLTT